MTIIHVHGGLANRLRAILSWREMCGSITVAWLPDGQVHGERFSDVFGPLPDVTFSDRLPIGTYVSTCDPHPNAPAGWERAYLELDSLHPAPALACNYSAIHVRRTDAIQYQMESGVHEPESMWIEWLKPIQWPTVFVATDNGTTQRELFAAIQKIGKHPRSHGHIEEHDRQDDPEVRNTTLRRAWWDIETCVAATAFRGSGASSYTNLIETLRRLHR